MTRRLAICLAVLAVAGAVRAAEPGPALKEGEVLRGRFVQERHLAGFGAPLRSEGAFVLAPGRGLIWTAERPFAMRTVISTAGLVQEVGGTRTLRIDAAQVPALARLFAMLGATLSGDWRALEGDFVVVRGGDDARWQARLTPRRTGDLALPFREVAVTGGHFVEDVSLTRAGDDFDRLTFTDQSVAPGPPTAAEVAAFDAAAR